MVNETDPDAPYPKIFMDDFDYLNKTLSDWLDEFFLDNEVTISMIENEYLTRYTAAIVKDLGLV